MNKTGKKEKLTDSKNERKENRKRHDNSEGKTKSIESKFLERKKGRTFGRKDGRKEE